MVATRRLLVASNRGPVSLVAGDSGELEIKRGGGGLVSGLIAALTASDGMWVCCALNDRERTIARRAPHGHLVEEGIETGGIQVRMLPIEATTFQPAYNEIATSTFWFINHMLYNTPYQPVFDSNWRRQWAAYERYNEAFAEALAEEAAEGACVLVQDYHLFLTPGQLRAHRPDVKIGHFTHTPWVPPEYFTLLPDDVASAVLRGILGADHVGFHSVRWAREFMRCCADLLNVDVNMEKHQVYYGDRIVEVGIHPLGVDATELRTRAQQQDVEDRIAHLRERIGQRAVISRVDRTELSKNVVRGLHAYRELLRNHPEWHGRVVHVACVYPSRLDIPEYREYTAAIERVAREIEDEFATEDWAPMLLEVSNDYPGSLAALRVCDVLFINPVRDGMNLVVKEGITLSERDCAVVLSMHAGAADQFGDDALLVNPYDITGTAHALYSALEMSKSERERRARNLVAKSTALPPSAWFSQQRDVLKSAAAVDT